MENICQVGKGKGSLGSHSHFRGEGRQGDEANSLALMILKDVQLSVTGQIDSDRPSFVKTTSNCSSFKEGKEGDDGRFDF